VTKKYPKTLILISFTDTTSLKLYVLVDRFSLWWSKRDCTRRLPGLIEGVMSVNLDPPIMERERQGEKISI
jgi:hypothetical protein